MFEDLIVKQHGLMFVSFGSELFQHDSVGRLSCNNYAISDFS